MNPPVTAGKILDAMPILREDSISNLTATTVSTESARNLSDCFNESFSTPSIGHETSSITSSNRRKKKSVSWSKKRQWRRHHRICDLSKEEQEAVWYTPEDSKIILAMARATGEVAPLMITGVVKLAPSLAIDGHWPFLIAGIVLAGPLVCGASQALNDWFDRDSYAYKLRFL